MKDVKKISLFNIVNTIIMLLVILVTAYPFYHVLVASFSDPTAVSTHTGLLLLPLKPLSTKAYEVVLGLPSIISGYKNSLFVLIVGVMVNMALTILGAYFLSIKGPMFKDIVSITVIISMYFHGGMVPEYLNVKDLGLLNSLWSLIIPTAIKTTNLIIMKSAFSSIPDSLVEAAQLDGASYWKILTMVMVPLSKATIAVLVLYYGVSHWNSWFNASIYLMDSSKFPLQLILRNLLNSLNGVEGMDQLAEYVDLVKYALIIVTTLPILVLYPFLQKYFAKGVMIGAVKG